MIGDGRVKLTVPIFVRTLCVSRPVHGRARRVLLRMNVPLGDGHVAVAGQIRQGPRVHVGRPPGEAGMSKSVKWKVFQTRPPAHLPVLPLQAGRLDVPAGSWSRKDIMAGGAVADRMRLNRPS